MSHITDEVIRVLSNQHPRRALTASEIYGAGEFEDIHPVYVAISTMAAKPDGRLLRSTPVNGGKYAYEVNPDPRKNGALVDIPEFVAASGAQPATDSFLWLAEKRAKKDVAAAQASSPARAEETLSRPAPAAAPAKVTPGPLPQSPQKNAGASGGVVSATPKRETSEKIGQLKVPAAGEIPLEAADQAMVEGPCLRAWEFPEAEPLDLEMDCLLASLVLRLPGKRDKWTKSQRESWLTMFNAAADFLYPESK